MAGGAGTRPPQGPSSSRSVVRGISRQPMRQRIGFGDLRACGWPTHVLDYQAASGRQGGVIARNLSIASS